MKNYGSLQLWFWTLVPVLFIALMCVVSALDERFNIGDRLLDFSVGLAMVLVSPFAWATQLKAEASAMRRTAVRTCKTVYGLQVGGIIAFYLIGAILVNR